MQDSISARVYDLVAEERGLSCERLRPDTTLSRDSGMEGDDAVEFFEDFATKFAVDLRFLHEDWHCYFGPEGVGIGGMLLIVVPTLTLGYLICLAVPVAPFWLAAIVGFAGWITIFWYWQSSRAAKDPQISIQDLVDCVNAGRWTKRLHTSVKSRFVQRDTYGGLGQWFTS
jgi:hypothetical protein